MCFWALGELSFLICKMGKLCRIISKISSGFTVYRVSHSVMSSFYEPMDHNPSGSSLHGILQARILEWVTISFSRISSRLRDRTRVFCIGRQILNHWATRGLPEKLWLLKTLTPFLCTRNSKSLSNYTLKGPNFRCSQHLHKNSKLKMIKLSFSYMLLLLYSSI